jgi:hypothetical protein
LSQSCSNSLVSNLAASWDSFGPWQKTHFTLEDHTMNSFTPSSKGAFVAGVGLWSLAWAALFKADDIASLGGFQQWFSREKCFRWIRGHKSTSLLATECVNYTTHGIADPLGVTFALGGTLVNAAMIYVLLPLLERAKRNSAVIGSVEWRSK